MRADERHVAAIGGMKGRRIAEREREVLETVDEPVEAEHLGVGCIPVGKPQGQLNLRADRRRWESHQHPFPRSASWNRDERA